MSTLVLALASLVSAEPTFDPEVTFVKVGIVSFTCIVKSDIDKDNPVVYMEVKERDGTLDGLKVKKETLVYRHGKQLSLKELTEMKWISGKAVEVTVVGKKPVKLRFLE